MFCHDFCEAPTYAGAGKNPAKTHLCAFVNPGLKPEAIQIEHLQCSFFRSLSAKGFAKFLMNREGDISNGNRYCALINSVLTGKPNCLVVFHGMRKTLIWQIM